MTLCGEFKTFRILVGDFHSLRLLDIRPDLESNVLQNVLELQ